MFYWAWKIKLKELDRRVKFYRTWKKKVGKELDRHFGDRVWRDNPGVDEVIRQGHQIHLYNNKRFRPHHWAVLMYYRQMTHNAFKMRSYLRDMLLALDDYGAVGDLLLRILIEAKSKLIKQEMRKQRGNRLP